MLEKNGGGHIILISDGRNSPEYLSITDVLPSIMKSGIRVITIALGYYLTLYFEICWANTNSSFKHFGAQEGG